MKAFIVEFSPKLRELAVMKLSTMVLNVADGDAEEANAILDGPDGVAMSEASMIETVMLIAKMKASGEFPGMDDEDLAQWCIDKLKAMANGEPCGYCGKVHTNLDHLKGMD